jgi:hypothetical protein
MSTRNTPNGRAATLGVDGLKLRPYLLSSFWIMKHILDRSFRYTPSHSTDIRKTFDRLRREREAARRQAEQTGQTVLQIKREKKSA